MGRIPALPYGAEETSLVLLPKWSVPEGTEPDARPRTPDLHRDRRHREDWQRSCADSGGRHQLRWFRDWSGLPGHSCWPRPYRPGAACMDNLADFCNFFFKDSMGRRISDHQAARLSRLASAFSRRSFRSTFPCSSQAQVSGW